MKILSVAMFNLALSSGDASRSYFSNKDLATKIHEAAGGDRERSLLPAQAPE